MPITIFPPILLLSKILFFRKFPPLALSPLLYVNVYDVTLCLSFYDSLIRSWFQLRSKVPAKNTVPFWIHCIQKSKYIYEDMNGGLENAESTPSLPSLPAPLWLGVVAPDRVLFMGQIELNCKLLLNWIAWNRIVLTSKLFEIELF